MKLTNRHIKTAVPVCCLLLFMFVYWQIGELFFISKLIGGVTFNDVDFNAIAVVESMYRNFWGVAFLVFSVASLFLIAWCLWQGAKFEFKLKLKAVLLIALLGFSVGVWDLTFDADMNGELAHVIYKFVDSQLSSNDIVTVPNFSKSAISMAVVLSMVTVVFVVLLLAMLVYFSHGQVIARQLEYLKTYRRLLYVTAVFLSTGILQLFFQYQWFSIYLSSTSLSSQEKYLIEFGYPLVISVFYVVVFLISFVPAGEILRNLAIDQVKEENNFSTVKESEAYLVENGGIYQGYSQITSFLLFMSPLITAVFAELIGLQYH